MKEMKKGDIISLIVKWTLKRKSFSLVVYLTSSTLFPTLIHSRIKPLKITICFVN